MLVMCGELGARMSPLILWLLLACATAAPEVCNFHRMCANTAGCRDTLSCASDYTVMPFNSPRVHHVCSACHNNAASYDTLRIVGLGSRCDERHLCEGLFGPKG
eukprot:Sspe_Gene.117952::Locus_110369_Transcript_1_1_Confidence_1.000_Length_362::g.117952::m.117952